MAVETATLILRAAVSQAPLSGENVVAASGPLPEQDESTVSVVVPSYNHAPFIARCLRSIITQSHSPVELIVIDDGSIDGSPKRIEEVLKHCPFDCELIARPHRGLAATLNQGLERSRGKYFAYLGSDDVWLDRFLEVRVRLLERRPKAVLAYGHAFIINEDDQVLECSGDWAQYSDGYAGHMLLHRIAPFSPSVLYRRDAVARHCWSEEAGLEDYDLYLRLSGDGEFAFDRQVLCAWRSHRYNKSRNLDFMLNECLKAQRRAMASLSVCVGELNLAHSELRWRFAADFIKAGQKRKALGLMCLNLKGAPSYSSVARMMVGLAVPGFALKWRRKFVQQRATRSYGSIQIAQ
jgi:alpha-1,3-rhamnosyltransferase